MHEGHRQRLLGKIKSGGALYEHELLEALLFNACPRKDLNDVAHALISRFQSLNGVLSQNAENLKTVDGVGESMAIYLEIIGKSLVEFTEKPTFATINTTADFKEFLQNRRTPAGNLLEIFFLDADGQVMRVFTVTQDKSGDYIFDAEKLIRAFSFTKTYGVFVGRFCATASGASATDDIILNRLSYVCKLGGVRLFDYCIHTGDGGFYSYFVTDKNDFTHVVWRG